MAEQSLKEQTVKGVIWSSIERFSVQGVQFLVMLIIARILEPKDFGLIGMLAIFLMVAQTLIDSGFTQALIRKQDRSNIDNCSVFYFNFVVSVLIYIFLYTVAPRISDFYEEPQLCNLMRVLCLIVIINGGAVVQRSIYTANVDFKSQAKASFTAAIISGIVGIWTAYKGFGAWALVWQQLLNSFINTLILWMLSNWHPQLIYSRKSIKGLFGFGSKVMAVALINTIYENLYLLIIGKIFNSADVGYYTQADRFTKLPSSNITGIIQRVTYPILCSIQDDNERLREDYRRLLRMSAFIIFPLMCLLAGVSTPLVRLLLGEKWTFTSSLIIPLCFGMMWYPVHSINLNLLQVKGRSDLFLELEIIKKVIGIVILCVSIPFGLLSMCYGIVFSSIISLLVNTYYTGKLIHVGFGVQMRDLSGTLISSLVLFAISYIICDIVNGLTLQLLFASFVGILTYMALVLLLKMPELSYLKSLIIRK